MDTASVVTAEGLFAGIKETINRRLNVANYQTLTAARQLAGEKPLVLNGKEFIQVLFEILSKNWDAISHGARKPSSAENFRWHRPRLSVDKGNKSLEVTLERAFMQACSNARRSDWSNQVPVISGIAGPRAFKRFAIDLVYQHDPKNFEFVELKIKSDTPLFAAIEVLLYGLLWLLSRRDQERLGYSENPIIAASSVRLSVLAPLKFYADLDLAEFFSALDAGISALGLQHGAQMAFRATAFPGDFVWPGIQSDQDLLQAFNKRVVL